MANMSEAQFFSSDFSAAQLVAADLKRAKFFRCKFDKTHLYSADIIGTDFVQCRPWEALLFFPPDPIGIDPVPFHTKGVRDISNLLNACEELKSGYGKDTTLYFRGEGEYL